MKTFSEQPSGQTFPKTRRVVVSQCLILSFRLVLVDSIFISWLRIFLVDGVFYLGYLF